MGFTSKTLPLERTGFWGGRILPFHGVMKTEWWPDKQEETLVASIVHSEAYLVYLVDQYGEETSIAVHEKFNQYEVFDWFTENFTRDSYTADYTIAVTQEMVWHGIEEFHKEVVQPWLASLDK